MDSEHALEFCRRNLEHGEQYFRGGVLRRCTFGNDHFDGVVSHLGAKDMGADGKTRVVREPEVKDRKAG